MYGIPINYSVVLVLGLVEYTRDSCSCPVDYLQSYLSFIYVYIFLSVISFSDIRVCKVNK
jgi:hypothetical protein